MWVKNKKNGKGVMNFSNGGSYNGEWVDDKACNYGVITYVNKDVYDGKYIYLSHRKLPQWEKARSRNVPLQIWW